MNVTTATSASSMSDDSNVLLAGSSTLGAVFFGFSAGAILSGITIRQAFQYYTDYTKDTIYRKATIGLVCLLDVMHLAFAMTLVYNLFLQLLGFPELKSTVLWSVKALGTVQTVLILIVQGFYLWQIWTLSLSGGQLLPRRFARAAQIFVVIISLFSVAVAVVFVMHLTKISVLSSFSSGFEYVIYLGFGATAIVDCAIAAAMCLILHEMGAGTERSENVLESIIQYFIGSGLLTSLAAIMCIVLYVAKPTTLIYLGLELSVTRLYASSVLAMSNARKGLHRKLNETMELKFPSNMFFGEPEAMSDTVSLIGSNHFSLGQETKYAESDISSISDKKVLTRTTNSSVTITTSRHYTV